VGRRVWLKSDAIVDALTIESLREFKPMLRYRSPTENPSPLKGKKKIPRHDERGIFLLSIKPTWDCIADD